jgi:hypothetical protein
MSQVIKKIDQLLLQYSHGGALGKLSKADLDKEFADNLPYLIYGQYSVLLSNTEQREKLAAKWGISNIEDLVEYLNLEFNVLEMKRTLDHKITKDKKAYCYNALDDLRVKGAIDSKYRLFFDKDKVSYQESITNFFQLVFLAFKIENLDFRKYIDVFLTPVSHKIKVFKYCNKHGIDNLDNFYIADFCESSSVVRDHYLLFELSELGWCDTFKMLLYAFGHKDVEYFNRRFLLFSPYNGLIYDILNHSTEIEYDTRSECPLDRYQRELTYLSLHKEKVQIYSNFIEKYFFTSSFRWSVTISQLFRISKDCILSSVVTYFSFNKFRESKEIELYLLLEIIKEIRRQDVVLNSNLQNKFIQLMLIEFYISLYDYPYKLSSILQPKYLEINKSITKLPKKISKIEEFRVFVDILVSRISNSLDKGQFRITTLESGFLFVIYLKICILLSLAILPYRALGFNIVENKISFFDLLFNVFQPAFRYINLLNLVTYKAVIKKLIIKVT